MAPRRSARLSTVAAQQSYQAAPTPEDDHALPSDNELSEPHSCSASAAPTPVPNTPQRPCPLFDNEDVIREVCMFLGRADLRSMLLVNKVSHDAAIPWLYRRLDIRLPSCPCLSCTTHSTLASYNEYYVRRYTTCLEYFPHPHFKHYRRHPDAPLLKTVIANYDSFLFLDNAQKGRRTDANGNEMRFSMHECSRCPGSIPESDRLVVRAINTNFNSRKGFKRHFIVPKSEHPHLVLHIQKLIPPAYLNIHNWYQFDFNHAFLPSENPKHMTFVIFPYFWDHGFVGARITRWDERSYASSYITVMANFVQKYIGRYNILIVGLEDACPWSPTKYWENRHHRAQYNPLTQVISNDMFDNNHFNHWTDEEKKSRHDKVKCKTFIDYLEDGDWGEELNITLVQRWVAAYHKREVQVREEADKLKKKKKETKRRKKRRRRQGTSNESEFDDSDDEYMPTSNRRR